MDRTTTHNNGKTNDKKFAGTGSIPVPQKNTHQPMKHDEVVSGNNMDKTMPTEKKEMTK